MLRTLVEFIKGFGSGLRSHSTEYVEFELREMENILALLLFSSFIGLPSPPSDLSLRLMPHMVREMHVMSRRAGDLDDISGEIAGMFVD
ncbi:MAG: hypothetical protein M0R22_03205 [Dehalococcoidia bacterium]|nr:hypothetical protein [Dehalococcoidia bacterium]